MPPSKMKPVREESEVEEGTQMEATVGSTNEERVRLNTSFDGSSTKHSAQSKKWTKRAWRLVVVMALISFGATLSMMFRWELPETLKFMEVNHDDYTRYYEYVSS